MSILARYTLIFLACGIISSGNAAQLDGKLRVQVAPAELSVVGNGIHATGVISAFRNSTVAAEVQGRVIARLTEPGAYLNLGDPVIQIDDERADLAVRRAQADAESLRVTWLHAQHPYIHLTSTSHSDTP